MADGSATKATRVWSPLQEAIFAEVEQGKGNIVVEALAGTGKSTTIEEIVTRTDADSSVLVCAFNAAIAAALKPRMPVGVETATIHSFGMRALGASMGRRLNVNKFRASDLLQLKLGRDRSSREARAFCAKLIGIAKGQAFDAAAARPSEAADRLDAWADAFGVDSPKEWSRDRLLRVSYDVLRDQQLNPSSEIDYDDMIWLPVVRGVAVTEYDYVLVDETQDLNPAQLALVQRAGRSGRVIAVGDRHQSIYGFRGADPLAIPRMIRELKATVLPLSITYRCASAIVAEANRYVPALQAAPSAAEGTVRSASLENAEAEMGPGDFVLSRTNAPLVALCFRLAKAGRRATIQGRDIGAGLAAWVKATGAGSIVQLAGAIRSWRAAEIARLDALERDTDGVNERAECLHAFCEGAESVAEVIAKIEAVFDDATSTAGRIVLSSTHRAKGLEADRVWMLRDTYLKRDTPEERNLTYVAITRAKRELVYVYDEKKEQNQ